MGFNFNFLKDANREKQALKTGFRFLKGVKEAVDSPAEIRDIVVGGARGIARTPETVLRSSAEAGGKIAKGINPDIDLPEFDSGAPTDPVRRALYGSEKVETYQTRQKGVEKTIGESRFRDKASPLSFLAAGLTVGADVTGAGGGKKKIVEEGAAALEKALAKEATEEGVKKILKGVVSDDVIQRTAGAVARAEDPNVVRNIMTKAVEVQKPTGFPIDDITRNKVDDVLGKVTNRQAPAGTKRLYQGTENGQPTDWYFDDPEQLKQFYSNRSDNVNFSVVDVPEKAAVPVPGKPGTFRVGKAPEPVPVEETAIDRVSAALKGNPAGEGVSPNPGVNSLNRKQADINRATRGERLGKAQAAGEGLTGEAATKARLAALAGKFPKVNAERFMENLRAKVDRDDFNELLDTIRTSPALDGNSYEPLKAESAFEKLFNEGRIPQPAEMALIEKALGQDIVGGIGQAAQESLTTGKKLRNFFADVLGAPKSIMSSIDISGGVRQGGVLGSRFWKEFGGAQKESLKYLGSQEAYDQGLAEIASRANASLYKKMGLSLAGKEEAFVSNIAEKIPVLGRGVAASDRAYTGGLSRLRADVADRIIGDLHASGAIENMTEKEWKSLGQFINTASGRGNLGSLEKHAITLGEALFSPRLWKSRLDMLNPAYYYKLKGPARKYALQSAASFSSIAGAVLGLAVLAGADVETDPRSSDFLKIKVGDTRYDILGGFQQNIVFAHRIATGEKKSSVTGAVTKLGEEYGGPDRLSLISDLFSNKANPVLGVAANEIRGKDKAGNELDPLHRAYDVASLGVPLNIGETVETVKNNEGNLTSAEGIKNTAKGVAKAAPGSIGVGVGTYGVKDLKVSDKQQRYLDKLKSGGRSEEEVKANAMFFKTLKTGPKKDQRYKDIDKALKAGDTEKARQLAKDYNDELSKAFDDWRKKYGKYKNQTLVKQYESSKIKLDTSSINSRIKKIKAEG